MDELETAFQESVNHYLEVSERTGKPAKKPFSGKDFFHLGRDLRFIKTLGTLPLYQLWLWLEESLESSYANALKELTR